MVESESGAQFLPEVGLEKVALGFNDGMLRLSQLGDIREKALGHLLPNSFFHNAVEFVQFAEVVLHLGHHGVQLLLLFVGLLFVDKDGFILWRGLFEGHFLDQALVGPLGLDGSSLDGGDEEVRHGLLFLVFHRNRYRDRLGLFGLGLAG